MALAGNLFAQSSVALAQDTPFLKEPGGIRLGILTAGTRVVPGRTSRGFAEVVLGGWIFTSSTQSDQREGFERSVKLSDGENIRAAPDGPILGRLVQGALFKRIGTRGGWSRVLRAGWIPRSAFAVNVTEAASTRVPSQAPPIPAAAPPSPPQQNPPEERRATLRSGTVVQRSPDGPALATLAGPVEATVGEQQSGEWIRVRLDGWVRKSEVDSAVAPRPAITAVMLRESPERYVGQTVDWRVQFLAVQQADELRPEMPLGHPYLLARGPLPESGFVYVMVSKEEANRFQGLAPLEELSLTVTVRAGRTRYLATPVVELVRRNP